MAANGVEVTDYDLLNEYRSCFDVHGWESENARRDHMIIILRRFGVRNERFYIRKTRENIKDIFDVVDVSSETKERMDLCLDIFLDQIDQIQKLITKIVSVPNSQWMANRYESHEIEQYSNKGQSVYVSKLHRDILEDPPSLEWLIHTGTNKEETRGDTDASYKIHYFLLKQQELLMKEINHIINSIETCDKISYELKVTKLMTQCVVSNLFRSHNTLTQITDSNKIYKEAYEQFKASNLSVDDLIQEWNLKKNEEEREKKNKLNSILPPGDGETYTLQEAMSIFSKAKNVKERKAIVQFWKEKNWVPEFTFANMTRALKRYKTNPSLLGTWNDY